MGLARGLRHPVFVAVAVATAATYAWWTTALRPFTWPALVAVEAAGIAAMLLGARMPGRRPSAGGRRSAPRGILVWVVLVTVLAGWELMAYFSHPRADHPTLSSLVDPVLDWHPVRAVAFLVWLTVGAGLARR